MTQDPSTLPPGEDVERLPAPDDEGWRRLSPRMLLVHPVRILWSLAGPLVVAIFFGSRGEDGDGRFGVWFALAGAVLALVAGAMTWFVTRYRFTPDQLQLRTGLLSRRVLTAPLDRVRSVDIESSPAHRVLGLAKVKVGTGVDAKQIELDGLTAAQAATLRVDLLRRAHLAGSAGPGALQGDAPAGAPAGATDGPAGAPATGEGTAYPAPGLPGPETPETELARIDWGWLRFAPFSLSSLVVVAGAVGVLAQFGDDLPLDRVDLAEDAWAWVLAQALVLIVVGAVLAVLVGWVLLSTASYVLTWWNLRVVREPNGNLRTSHGLFTTRSQTIEQAKIRGVKLGEPLLLRLVRGAELAALATGIGAGGTTKVLPPAPRAVAQEVGHELLEESGPLTMTLRGHGQRARRRMHVSAQWGSLFLAALVALPVYLGLWWFADWPRWVPLAVLAGAALLNALLTESAWRHLGHGRTARHLVVQTGALVRTREVLESAGIIGWTLHQGFFQRRRGLADLTATTAAGSEFVIAPNIPLGMAVQLARETTPGMLDDLVV